MHKPFTHSPSRFSVLPLSVLCVSVVSLAATLSAAESIPPEQLEFFEAKIRPVLVEHCYSCHNSIDTAEGGLVLDHRAAVLKGGDTGSVVTAGNPAGSRLLATIRHEIEGLEMPDGGPKLDEAVVADFAKWIQLGLPDPRDKAPTAEEFSQATSWESVLAARKKWWSFQPIASPAPPEVEGVGNRIDRFIAAKWDEQNLAPAEPADAQTLVRRLYFNLIGLPPSPEETAKWVDAIETGDREQQLEALVDELLASPHFGERWARHWMDWIRYAETHGSEGDPAIENAWLYRDYLIRALNADVPYDQLVREHVAGDLLSNPRIADGINESLIGTAHWRMVFHGFAPTDALDERVRFTDDQIDTFSKAFLGLTVSCARCHDHKFDAISQADYYALFGIFASCRPGRSVIETEAKLSPNRDELEQLKPQIRTAIAGDWLTSLPTRVTEAATQAVDKEKPVDINNPLYPLLETRRRVESGTDFNTAWTEVREQLARRLREGEAPAEPRTRDNVLHHWNLSNPNDAAQWTATGFPNSPFPGEGRAKRAEGQQEGGLQPTPAPPGSFAINANTPDAPVLHGIYPAGVYSHLLSNKDPGRLTSRDFPLNEPAELWLRVNGDHNASVRYVVQDYPRNGTVYPVAKMDTNWRWQKFDLNYWTGDTIHIEATTALDAPLLTSNSPRSWIGITEAIVTKPGTFKPTEAVSQWQALITATEQNPPASIDDLSEAFASTVNAAISAWSSNSTTNPQAELLGRLLGTPVLPNTLDQLPTAAPLVQRYRELETQLPAPTRVPTLEEAGGTDQALFVRGNHKLPADVVPRRFLEAIDDTPYDTPLSGRLELADDLVAADNPFTRRVIVNRIWHHLFGEGLVPTPDNFGQLGSKPTHPELLDYLATQFSNNDWSIKQFIKSLVLTDSWQLSSSAPAETVNRDPDNKYLARANVRRLEAEAIRDSLLAVSGRINPELFGPQVGSGSRRRSVYVRVARNNLDPFLRTFDFPEPSKATGRRSVTNVPAQALALMNDGQIATYAANLAKRVTTWEGEAPAEPSAEDSRRITHLFHITLSREPSPSETNRLQSYLNSTRTRIRASAAERQHLTNEVASLANQLTAIEQPIRERLRSVDFSPPDSQQVPAPIAAWDFTQSLNDTAGLLNTSLQQQAAQTSAGLHVANNGYAITPPLDKTIREKTLEAWVRLGNLDQRGGGVMTIQSLNGVTFDSIVFGEITPREWLAGSNNHKRSMRVDGPAEEQAVNEPVHLAITYAADGTITCYRNGVPYGQPYKTEPPVEFAAGQTNIAFGLRHLPAGGNRLLDGTVIRARLYDRALSTDEVEASYAAAGQIITQKQILAVMTEIDRAEYESLKASRDRLRTQLDAIPQSTGPNPEWTELARAILLFKEFIYLQ